MTPYRPRLVDAALAIDLDTFPVVVLTGARQTGKSTLSRESTLFQGRPCLTLDDPDVWEQAAHAPLDLLQRHPILTLDEVQRELGLLQAAKALVDRDRPRRPGRLLLTGSAKLLLMKAVVDSLAGRAAWRTLHPLTRREQLGLGRAGAWGELLAAPWPSWPDLLHQAPAVPEDWAAFARRGGFPVPALELEAPGARSAWFEGYVRTYLERDLRDLSSVQDLPAFRRLMRAAALRTGGLLNQAELGRDVGMPLSSVQRHLGLLETSHLLIRLEAFSVNRSLRVIKAPKLYWVDTALGLHLGGVEPGGAHLESLVLGDLLAWADAAPGPRPQVMHWRTASGREVDFVVEVDGRLLAVEVKATRRPTPHDARHLAAFREEHGDAVVGGLLLHGGEELFRMGEGIIAAPWWRVI